MKQRQDEDWLRAYGRPKDNNQSQICKLFKTIQCKGASEGAASVCSDWLQFLQNPAQSKLGGSTAMSSSSLHSLPLAESPTQPAPRHRESLEHGDKAWVSKYLDNPCFLAACWISYPGFAGEPAWTRWDGNAQHRPWSVQVRWGTQPLLLHLRLIRFDVSPLGSAWACSPSFCWWAARVLSGLSCLITFSSEGWYAERSVLLMLKAGFSMPSVAALSSFTIENKEVRRAHYSKVYFNDKQKIPSSNSFAERLKCIVLKCRQNRIRLKLTLKKKKKRIND